MSFLDTLKSLGLWQGAPQGQTPYGMDPALLQQARMASLGNIGSQLLAASVKQTANSRANVLANADWTGGYQNNLYNAMQMQQMSRQAQMQDLEAQRAMDARKAVADMIKKMPPGKTRDAAMYFFQAGDLNKAGEIAWTQKKKFDPMTGTDVTVDYFDNPVGGSVGSVPGPSVAPPAAAAGGSPAPGPAPSSSSSSLPAPAGGPVDQLTTNWRRLLQDPNLTPTEARVIASQGSQKEAMSKYAEIVKQRQSEAASKASQDQTALQNNRSAAQQLTSDFDAGTKSYDTIIGAGQRAAQVAMSPKMTASQKLSTLYQFMKALDPDGAVREGDVAMAQAMQNFKDQWMQFAEAQLNGGGPISDSMVLDMAREMARLANDAAGRKERKRIQMIRSAQGRQIPTEMVADIDPNGSQNMPAPIGYGIPTAPRSPDNTPVQVAPEDEGFIQHWLGG